jgi:hypothetical protein
MLLILKIVKIFKKYYKFIVVVWQHMFSVPVMRTVWRRESGSRLHTVRVTVSTQTSAWFSSYYTQLNINILIKHYLTLQYAAT